MAIAVVYRPPGMTVDQYKASWSGPGPEGQPVATPRGLLFHAGVGEGDDFFTMTVWDSPESYEAFAPVFRQVMSDKGFDFGRPAILPVHHTIDP
jgi:hypothetical protein